MNKLFIVLLALCLVSVHAFVKRDAPAPTNEQALADIGKSIKDLLDSFGAQINASLNPDQLKKKFGEVVDGVQNSFNQFKANSETAKQ